MIKRILAHLLLPYFRGELPGWGRLMRVVRVSGPDNDVFWTDSPELVVVGKSHGYRMRLELKDWCQRMTFFLGRYYEFHVLRLIDSILKPGDRAVDVGGNIGMIALQMAKRVTDSGTVECFEPNPACVQRIQWHKSENRLSQLKVHPYALGDRDDTLELKLLGNHTGWSTFGEVSTSEFRSIPVPVRVGDEVLGSDRSAIRLIKIDVEGFELRVLRGLSRTLAQHKPVLIMELIDGQLEHANSSSKEIFEFLGRLGYECYGLSVGGSKFHKRLELKRVQAYDWKGGFLDVAWIHRDDSTALETMRASKVQIC